MSNTATALPRGASLSGPFCVGELGRAGDERGTSTPRSRVLDVGGKKLEYIMDLIRKGSHHPKVVETARRIVANVKDKDAVGEIRAVWEWLRDNVRYVRDPLGREVIQTANRMLDPVDVLPEEVSKRLPKPLRSGDCDEMGAVLAGALLRSIGHHVRIALWGRGNNPWQHIFTLAYASNEDAWYPVDPTEKNRPFAWLPPFGRWTAFRMPDDNVPTSRIVSVDDAGNRVDEMNVELDGFFDDLWKGVKSAAGEVWQGIRKAIPAVATVAASQIPGIGSAAGPLIGSLVNGLVNKGENNELVMQTAQALAKGNSPESVLTAVAGKTVPVFGPVASQLVQKFVLDQSREAIVRGPGESAADFNARRGALFMTAAQRMAHEAAQQAPVIADQQMQQHPQVQQMPPQHRPQPQTFMPAFRQQAATDFQPSVFQQPQQFQQFVAQQPPQRFQQFVQRHPAAFQQVQQQLQQQQQPQFVHPQQQSSPPQFVQQPQQCAAPSQFQPAPQFQPFVLPQAQTGFAPQFAGMLGEIFDNRNVTDELAAAERLLDLAGI